MSTETLEWLNNNCLIGLTDKRGTAWHYRASEQGAEPNHYPGFIPVEDVVRRLFHWEAVEQPIFLKGADGTFSPVEGRKAITRSDQPGTVFGVFKDGYVPHQYKGALLDTLEHILGPGLGIGSAGLLKNGAIAWVQVEVPESFKTAEGVEFRPHLLAGTSFDGTLATSYARVVTDVVCDNTKAIAERESGQKISIKHSRYSGVRVKDVQQALNLIHEMGNEYAEQVTQLCNITVSDAEFDAFLDEITPIPEQSGRGATLAGTKRDILTQLYDNDSRCAPWNGTAYGVLQADNTYRHHYAIARGAAGGRAERNLQNAVLGITAEKDDVALAALAKVKGVDQLLVAA